MSAAFAGNLDCERRWAGLGPLPGKVAAHAAALATLARALAPDDLDEVYVWTVAAVAASRLPTVAGLPGLRLGVGDAPADAPTWGAHGEASRDGDGGETWRALAWTARTPASIAARVNDRRWAQALASHLGCALPGARVVDAAADLTDVRGPWVAKAPLTAAGRDRAWGDGPPAGETSIRLGRLLATFGALVLEPWLPRLLDVATCGVVARADHVVLRPTHGGRLGPRGQFAGIDLAPPALTPDELARVRAVAAAVGAALAASGYRGAFAVDAFVYQDPEGARRLHPLVEVNARYTFGHVAHALGERCGAAALGLGPVPPAGARVLVEGAAWLE